MKPRWSFILPSVLDGRVLLRGIGLLAVFCVVVSQITFVPCEPPILKTILTTLGLFALLLVPGITLGAYDRARRGQTWKCYFLTNLAVTVVLGLGAAYFFMAIIPRPRLKNSAPEPQSTRP